LIELMVGLVVGLIVAGAAVGFVVSVAKANSDDIQVTRLTQELRAVSEVVNREIRRARYVSDPIGNVTQGAAGPPPLVNDTVTVSDSPNGAGSVDCITLRYDRPPTEAPGTVTRTVYLDTGRVYFSGTAGCSGGEAISSPEVTITQLSFDNDTSSSNAAAPIEGFVRTTVGGQLATAVGDLASLTRTFQQDTYIRSGKVD